MTAKLLAAFMRCFDDEFAAVRAEACIACSRLRIRDDRVVSRLGKLINDDPIHRVKALAIQGLFTSRVSRRRREMYCGHARLCVCLSVCLSAAACLHYCTDPYVTWRSGTLVGDAPPVVHYWADLQSVHELRCYGNITRTRNVSEYMLVLVLCLVCACGRHQCY